LKSAKRFVYGVRAMAWENGKARSGGGEPASPIGDFVPTIKLLEQDAAERGPWTEEDEEWFQIMIEEFGGAPE
jgi:hypothetical protein